MVNPTIKDPLCQDCGETDPDKFISRHNRKEGKYYRDKSRCKRCTLDRRKITYDPRKKKAYDFDKMYGISLDRYERLLEEQDRKCSGCGMSKDEDTSNLGRHWPVDHNHTTGKIRGILCTNYNNALGRVKDNPVTLRRLADYLERG